MLPFTLAIAGLQLEPALGILWCGSPSGSQVSQPIQALIAGDTFTRQWSDRSAVRRRTRGIGATEGLCEDPTAGIRRWGVHSPNNSNS